jgi:hypothetical protein
MANTPTKKTTIDDYYSVVKSEDPITLKLTIGGYGQEALSRVKIDGQSLGPDQSGTFELVLGSGDALVGKILKIKTLVTDANRNPDDNTSKLYIVLTGGSNPYERTLESTVDTDGDTEDYSIKIQFYEAR